ncbi:MAG TPA: DNA translocase FtsK 4TM domain-containing protein, partial [Mizugakiibacter sp.]
MARAANAKGKTPAGGLSEGTRRILREAGALLLLPLALYLLACLASYSPMDPGWSHAGQPEQVHNFGGTIGAYLADLLLYLFGALAYAFPILLGVLGVSVVRGRDADAAPSPLEPTLRLIGFVAFFAAGSGLAHLHFDGPSRLPNRAGGILGELVGSVLMKGFGFSGATLFLLALFLVAVTLATGLSWFKLMDATGRFALAVGAWFGGKLKRVPEAMAARA